MKKILSALLCVLIFCSVFTIGVSAKGQCLLSDDFSNGFSSGTWMRRGGYDACAFMWDQNNEYLYGEDDAIVLQTNYVDNDMLWRDYYYSIDVRVQEGGLGESDTSNVIIQFQDLYESGVKNAPVYSYSIIPQTGEAYLVKEFEYVNEYGNTEYSWVAMDKSYITGYIHISPNGNWFNMGMRVSDGKIQCYYDGELILESSYNANDKKLGRYNQNTPDSTVGKQRYPFVFINYNHILNLDNFQVWTGDYDLKTLAGDVNGDGKTNISDVSRLLQKIAGWKNVLTDINQTDLNGDSSTNISDVTLLLKHLAGWNVTLGKK